MRVGGCQQVPLWQSPTDTTKTLVALDSTILRIETESPTITQNPLFGCGSEGYGGNGEGDENFGSGDATLQAEEELREARYATALIIFLNHRRPGGQ